MAVFKLAPSTCWTTPPLPLADAGSAAAAEVWTGPAGVMVSDLERCLSPFSTELPFSLSTPPSLRTVRTFSSFCTPLTKRHTPDS